MRRGGAFLAETAKIRMMKRHTKARQNEPAGLESIAAALSWSVIEPLQVAEEAL